MTDRKVFEYDVRPAQQLRASYMDAVRKKLAELGATKWDIRYYPASVQMISADKKRVLTISALLVFTIDVVRGPLDVKSSAFRCKTVDEAWNLCHATLKAYTR